jgi:hypothetical protein
MLNSVLDRKRYISFECFRLDREDGNVEKAVSKGVVIDLNQVEAKVCVFRKESRVFRVAPVD